MTSSRRLVPVVLVCIAVTCAALAENDDEARKARAADADDLLIVHCSLPGQIRQLGRNSSYLSARRPARTTALDCRVRGGEYVVQDRASLKTALNVWLEKARSGDPEAATTVGEIFEQGLGVPPDYAAAAEWYRRAAEQGFERALINLGYLYEQGRGVVRDPALALDYYRRAAGLDGAMALEPDTGLGRSSGVAAAELGALRARVIELENEGEALQSALLAAQERLSSAAANGAAQAEEMRARADEAEKQADRQRMLVQAREAAILELNDALARMQESLASRDAEITSLRAAVSDEREAESAIEDLKSELLTRRTEAWEARQALQAALAESDARLSQVSASHAEREALLNHELRSYMTQLFERETALAAQARQTDELLRELQALRSDAETTARNSALAQRNFAGPTITLVDPSLPSTRDTETRGLVKISLQSAVTQRTIVGQVAAPAGLLSLTVNDRPATANAAGVFRIDVPVSKETGVHIAAIDQQGKRADLYFEFARPAELPVDAGARARRSTDVQLGRTHALLIGNNEYHHLPNLVTPINDVRRLEQVLSTDYGFATTRLENANRYELLSALNGLRERLTSEENLLVYYAGHGELDDVNNRGHWLPVDAEPDSTANWVSNVAITDILNVIPAKQVLLVVDSCYAGTLTRSSIGRLETGMTEKERRTWLQIMSRKRARVVLTSGGLAPVLDIGGGGHSVFARALLETLESNRDLMTGRALHQAVAARVAHAAADYEFEQLPEYAPISRAGHEAGDFFLQPM